MTDGQTNGQTNRQTDRQTGRHLHQAMLGRLTAHANETKHGGRLLLDALSPFTATFRSRYLGGCSRCLYYLPNIQLEGEPQKVPHLADKGTMTTQAYQDVRLNSTF